MCTHPKAALTRTPSDNGFSSGCVVLLFFLPFFLALSLPFLPSNISHLSFLFLLLSTCLVVSCQTAKYTAFQDKNGSEVRSPHVSRHARQCRHITPTVLVLYFRTHASANRSGNFGDFPGRLKLI